MVTTFERGIGLRTKLGLLAAFFMAGGAAAAGIIAQRQTGELAYEASLQHGRAVLDALAVPSAIAIATGDYPKLDNTVEELHHRQQAEILLLLVVDHQGRLMVTSEEAVVGVEPTAFDRDFTAAALTSDALLFRFGPDLDRPSRLDIAKPLVEGQRWGTLFARFSMARVNERLERLSRSIALISILVAIAAWIVAFLVLERLVVRPTRRLADMAERIGGGDLGVRARVTRSDEIGSLGASLNRMAAHLRAHTARLEDAVRTRTADLEAANRELERLATTDALTGVRNRRFFESTVDFEIRRGMRHRHDLVLLMLDIDHFKTYNDTHGHVAGDEALKKVGAILNENLRSTDMVARYGGEEFAVLLLDTTSEEGFATAQKICHLVREASFEGEELLPGGRLTISVGVASFPEDADSRDALVRHADLALYEAKRRGRDAVVKYSFDIPQSTGLTSDVAPMTLPEDLERALAPERPPEGEDS